ncbi:MAG: serine/threonine-protein kinase [Terriglobia bacterium]|jgi:serine/threonine-protein kinase
MKKFGRYEVVEELGRGAMGVVYKASDPTIGRMVAIKVLSLDDRPEEGGPSSREIFMREARAAGRLSHPGIVTIHDALEDEATKSSYIVMEYIPGQTLEKILFSTPRIGAEKTLEIIRQVAEGLEYAHRNQIIHRDLKPANIILTEDGRAKITDFGIAKIAAQGVMRTVAVMGTPAYMSPEQVAGGEIDARADIFSMGILLYLMLVGEKPFMGDTAAVMFKIVYEDPVLPSKVNPLLTPALDYLVLRCLAKDRVKRYSSAREFLDDLDDVRQGRPLRSQARVPASEVHTAERTMAASLPLISMVSGSVSTPATTPPTAPGPEPVPAPVAPVTMPPAPVAAAPATPPHLAAVPAAPSPALASAEVAAAAPVTAAPLEKKKSATPVVVIAGVVLAAVLVAGGIWIKRGTEAPPQTETSKATPAPAKTSPSRPKTSPKTQAANLKAPPAAESKAASAEKTPAAAPAAPGRSVTLYCKYDFQEATLQVQSVGGTIFLGSLTGKKKKKILGLAGGGYGGELLQVLTIPADAKELTVRVYNADSSINVLNKISATPPSDQASVLKVTPSRDHLNLEWSKPKTPGR